MLLLRGQKIHNGHEPMALKSGYRRAAEMINRRLG